MSKRTSAPPKRLRVGTGTLRHACLVLAGLALATNVTKAQTWVLNTGSIPFDAIAAGYEPVGVVGRPGVGIPLPLYVCRGGAEEGMGSQVGNFRAGFAGCNIGYGGSQQFVPDFQFLVSDWQPASSGSVPSNALEGGWDDKHQPLYYCRANIAGSDLEPGKIGAGYAGCSIPYGGEEKVATSYQVLVGSPALPFAKVTASGGSVPPDAILAGTDDDGAGLFLCAVTDGLGGFLPGKLRSSFKGCDVSYGGGEHVVTGAYVVLVAKWAKFAAPPPFLSFDFTAGFDVGGQPLYACRAYSGGGVYPGKMQQTWSACDFGWGGTEQWGTTFDVLSSTH